MILTQGEPVRGCVKHLWHSHTQQVVQETRESAPLSILVMTQGVQVDIPGEERATNKILFERLSEITYNLTWKTSSNRNMDKVLKISDIEEAMSGHSLHVSNENGM